MPGYSVPTTAGEARKVARYLRTHHRGDQMLMELASRIDSEVYYRRSDTRIRLWVPQYGQHCAWLEARGKINGDVSVRGT